MVPEACERPTGGEATCLLPRITCIVGRSPRMNFDVVQRHVPMRSMAKTVTSAMIAVAVVLVVGLGIGSVAEMPGRAPVYLDDSSRTFLAAPCLAEWRTRTGAKPDAARLGTAAEARYLQYSPDEICRRTGLHSPGDRSVTGHLFELLGLLPPLKQWWDEQ
jgi:hypothetical protein